MNLFTPMFTLLHSVRSLFTALPASSVEPRSVTPADHQRRLAFTLLNCNPGVAADLFAAGNRQEQWAAR